MSAPQLALVISDGLVVLSALIASAFVAIYWWTARWWETEMGRNVMALMGVIAAVLDLSAVRLFTQPLPAPPRADWFLWLRLAVFAFVPVALGWRLWILVRLQILGDEESEREKDNV